MTEKKGKVKFVRIRGRIVPIRQKIEKVGETLTEVGGTGTLVGEGLWRYGKHRQTAIHAFKKNKLGNPQFQFSMRPRAGMAKEVFEAQLTRVAAHKLRGNRKLLKFAAKTRSIGLLIASLGFAAQLVGEEK